MQIETFGGGWCDGIATHCLYQPNRWSWPEIEWNRVCATCKCCCHRCQCAAAVAVAVISGATETQRGSGWKIVHRLLDAFAQYFWHRNIHIAIPHSGVASCNSFASLFIRKMLSFSDATHTMFQFRRPSTIVSIAIHSHVRCQSACIL